MKMLINYLWNSNAKTDEEYKEVLKGKIKLYYFLACLGVITLLISYICSNYVQLKQGNFLSGVYFGIGVALVVMGILRVVMTKRMLKDDKKLHEIRLNVQDERTKALSQKAMATAGLIILVFAYIGMLVMGFFNLAVFWTFWIMVMGYLLVYLLVRQYYNQKY